MGLDITAYSKLVYLETMGAGAWEQKYYYTDGPLKDRTVYFYITPDFPGRAEPIVHQGIYRIDGETEAFPAGPYSAYNRWREWLSQLALGVPPSVVWKAREVGSALFRRRPFVELIDFSDCEGVIGSVVAAKLAQDFQAFQTKADDLLIPDLSYSGNYKAKYALWRRAFELAADNGAVKFH